MKEFHVNELIAVDCHGAPKPYHIDKGVARGLFCPGRRAWQEVAADDLDQYAGHKGQIKNNAEKAKCMVKNRQKLIKSLFETAH